MQDGTYLSRNSATLGPLTSQPPCVGRLTGRCRIQLDRLESGVLQGEGRWIRRLLRFFSFMEELQFIVAVAGDTWNLESSSLPINLVSWSALQSSLPSPCEDLVNRESEALVRFAPSRLTSRSSQGSRRISASMSPPNGPAGPWGTC